MVKIGTESPETEQNSGLTYFLRRAAKDVAKQKGHKLNCSSFNLMAEDAVWPLMCPEAKEQMAPFAVRKMP